jgi:hypothetical protein
MQIKGLFETRRNIIMDFRIIKVLLALYVRKFDYQYIFKPVIRPRIIQPIRDLKPQRLRRQKLEELVGGYFHHSYELYDELVDR